MHFMACAKKRALHIKAYSTYLPSSSPLQMVVKLSTFYDLVRFWYNLALIANIMVHGFYEVVTVYNKQHNDNKWLANE